MDNQQTQDTELAAIRTAFFHAQKVKVDGKWYYALVYPTMIAFQTLNRRSTSYHSGRDIFNRWKLEDGALYYRQVLNSGYGGYSKTVWHKAETKPL